MPFRISFRQFLAKLGPGVITGAANDDPACIVTYAIAGASFGYLTLWTSLAFFPLLAVIQLMCSRLGVVSGRGLAGAVRVHYRGWVLIPTCALLAIANVVQLGADLGGMAEVTAMVSGLPAELCGLFYAFGIAGLLMYSSYRRLVRVFKWLCLVLFAYVAAAILARPNLDAVLSSTLIPQFRFTGNYLSTVVALVGATFSPYIFYWQSQSEVEEQYSRGRRRVNERKQAASETQLERSRTDVVVGAFISKLITYFITLTTAATLFVHGHRNIATARDAAASLQPVAGSAASLLFAVGLIGTGLLGIPALAGSCAYAFTEAVQWRASLHERPRALPGFYSVLGLSILIGVGLIHLRIGAVRMLFWASILNGLLAPVSMALVVLLTSARSVMEHRANTPPLRRLGWMAVAVVTAAALGLLLSVI